MLPVAHLRQASQVDLVSYERLGEVGMPSSVWRLLLDCQRTLVVAVAITPLVLVSLASLPALLFLPFSATGAPRAVAITRQFAAWTTAILHGTSRSTGG
jgi:hypothetical protein